MSDYTATYTVGLHSETTTFASIFTALHGMQTRSSDENSVRPSHA